ncbi:hypothetical protein Ciccas_010108 [Cichlidogyrus casuarinus]|uniref:Uncharacterized protein n=1 Tax=Cichlidogyrus casuarinus TaxID=1844966 RepID=A0ABD2PV25_9PLAT
MLWRRLSKSQPSNRPRCSSQCGLVWCSCCPLDTSTVSVSNSENAVEQNTNHENVKSKVSSFGWSPPHRDSQIIGHDQLTTLIFSAEGEQQSGGDVPAQSVLEAPRTDPAGWTNKKAIEQCGIG